MSPALQIRHATPLGRSGGRSAAVWHSQIGSRRRHLKGTVQPKEVYAGFGVRDHDEHWMLDGPISSPLGYPRSMTVDHLDREQGDAQDVVHVGSISYPVSGTTKGQRGNN